MWQCGSVKRMCFRQEYMKVAISRYLKIIAHLYLYSIVPAQFDNVHVHDSDLFPLGGNPFVNMEKSSVLQEVCITATLK